MISLIAYREGWICNTQSIDQKKYDGARFWLNLRLAFLGWPIPESPKKGWTLKDLRRKKMTIAKSRIPISRPNMPPYLAPGEVPLAQYFV